MLDNSEIYVKELSYTIINLYKLAIEEMGYDMGVTNNEIEYRNYLVKDPLLITLEGEPVFKSKSKTKDKDKNKSTKEKKQEPIIDEETIVSLEDKPNNNVKAAIKELESGGMLYGGVYIPQVVIDANKKLLDVKLPSGFMEAIKKASKVTGISVPLYILLAGIESTFTDNRDGVYKGYFQQPPNEGGIGTIYQQATGKRITELYNSAKNSAKEYGFDKNIDDYAAWCYLVHNCGPAGAKTFLKAINYELRQDKIETYKKGATAFVNKHGQAWSKANQIKQVKEKTYSVPKAYYVAHLLHKKNML